MTQINALRRRSIHAGQLLARRSREVAFMPDFGFARRRFLAQVGRAALLVTGATVPSMRQSTFANPEEPLGKVKTLEPDQEGRLPLEKTLAERRSVREFARGSLTLAELSQLLWAGQGITNRLGFRTAPSAGALYPLELYAAVGEVEPLPAGVFRYNPAERLLEPVGAGDRRAALSRAALSQSWIGESAVVIAVAAVARRTTRKYGKRGRRYVYIEAGHVAQNICLQAVSLGLGVTPVGAFEDDEVKAVLALSAEEEPIYLLPVGRR